MSCFKLHPRIRIALINWIHLAAQGVTSDPQVHPRALMGMQDKPLLDLALEMGLTMEEVVHSVHKVEIEDAVTEKQFATLQ